MTLPKASWILRLAGAALVLAALFGLVLSLGGIVVVWRQKTPMTQAVLSDLRLAQSVLASTGDALDLADDSLRTAVSSVQQIETTLEVMATSLEDTSPLITSLSSLLRQDIPTTIQATQTSLVAAQASAEIIDEVLTAITSIPFLTITPYNPPVPLHVALGEVSTSLDELPPSLEDIDASLADTDKNLTSIQIELRNMVDSTNQIRSSLSDARAVVGDYQRAIQRLSNRVNKLVQHFPAWADRLALGLTVLLGWVALTQVGLLVQGLTMLQNANPNPGPQSALQETLQAAGE